MGKKTLLSTIPKTSGIYCFENKKYGTKYIGKAINLHSRISNHLSQLRLGKDECLYLQNAWSKHGEDSFIFYILEECERKLIANREIFYIKKLKTKRPFGYNLTDGGDGSIGYKHTKEALEKMKLKDAIFGEANGNSKLTEKDVFSILLKYYFKNKTTVDLESEYNINNSMISAIVRGKNWKNIFSKFMREYSNPEKPDYTNKNQGGENNGRALLTEKQVYTILDLYHVKHNSYNTIAEKFKVGKHVISYVCTGKTWRNVYNNFMLDYKL